MQPVYLKLYILKKENGEILTLITFTSVCFERLALVASLPALTNQNLKPRVPSCLV